MNFHIGACFVAGEFKLKVKMEMIACNFLSANFSIITETSIILLWVEVRHSSGNRVILEEEMQKMEVEIFVLSASLLSSFTPHYIVSHKFTVRPYIKLSNRHQQSVLTWHMILSSFCLWHRRSLWIWCKALKWFMTEIKDRSGKSPIAISTAPA